MAKKEQEISYEQALEELSEIQAALENNEVSIDELAQKVQRAHYLVALCEAKLRNTEAEIQKIWIDRKTDKCAD